MAARSVVKMDAYQARLELKACHPKPFVHMLRFDISLLIVASVFTGLTLFYLLFCPSIDCILHFTCYLSHVTVYWTY